jgi:hypothetical protein
MQNEKWSGASANLGETWRAYKRQNVATNFLLAFSWSLDDKSGIFAGCCETFLQQFPLRNASGRSRASAEAG